MSQQNFCLYDALTREALFWVKSVKLKKQPLTLIWNNGSRSLARVRKNVFADKTSQVGTFSKISSYTVYYSFIRKNMVAFG